MAMWTSDSDAKGTKQDVIKLKPITTANSANNTVVVGLVADEQYYGPKFKRNPKSMAAQAERWMGEFVRERTLKACGSTFKWKSRAGIGGGKPQMMGLWRVPKTKEAFDDIGEANGRVDSTGAIFYVMIYEWDATMPEPYNRPCKVARCKKASGQSTFEYAKEAGASAGPMGVALCDGFLGHRHPRSTDDDTMRRTWRLRNVPTPEIWYPQQVYEILEQVPQFDDVKVRHALEQGTTASWEFIATTSRDFEEIEFTQPINGVDVQLLAYLVQGPSARESKRVTTPCKPVHRTRSVDGARAAAPAGRSNSWPPPDHRRNDAMDTSTTGTKRKASIGYQDGADLIELGDEEEDDQPSTDVAMTSATASTRAETHKKTNASPYSDIPVGLKSVPNKGRGDCLCWAIKQYLDFYTKFFTAKYQDLTPSRLRQLLAETYRRHKAEAVLWWDEKSPDGHDTDFIIDGLPATFDQYIEAIFVAATADEDGAWLGALDIYYLARKLCIPVMIFQRGVPPQAFNEIAAEKLPWCFLRYNGVHYEWLTGELADKQILATRTHGVKQGMRGGVSGRSTHTVRVKVCPDVSDKAVSIRSRFSSFQTQGSRVSSFKTQVSCSTRKLQKADSFKVKTSSFRTASKSGKTKSAKVFSADPGSSPPRQLQSCTQPRSRLLSAKVQAARSSPSTKPEALCQGKAESGRSFLTAAASAAKQCTFRTGGSQGNMTDVCSAPASARSRGKRQTKVPLPTYATKAHKRPSRPASKRPGAANKNVKGSATSATATPGSVSTSSGSKGTATTLDASPTGNGSCRLIASNMDLEQLKKEGFEFYARSNKHGGSQFKKWTCTVCGRTYRGKHAWQNGRNHANLHHRNDTRVKFARKFVPLKLKRKKDIPPDKLTWECKHCDAALDVDPNLEGARRARYAHRQRVHPDKPKADFRYVKPQLAQAHASTMAAGRVVRHNALAQKRILFQQVTPHDVQPYSQPFGLNQCVWLCRKCGILQQSFHPRMRQECCQPHLPKITKSSSLFQVRNNNKVLQRWIKWTAQKLKTVRWKNDARMHTFLTEMRKAQLRVKSILKQLQNDEIKISADAKALPLINLATRNKRPSLTAPVASLTAANLLCLGAPTLDTLSTTGPPCSKRSKRCSAAQQNTAQGIGNRQP